MKKAEEKIAALRKVGGSDAQCDEFDNDLIRQRIVEYGRHSNLFFEEHVRTWRRTVIYQVRFDAMRSDLNGLLEILKDHPRLITVLRKNEGTVEIETSFHYPPHLKEN